MSSGWISLPRYRNVTIVGSMNLFFLERKAKMLFPRGDTSPHRRGSHAGRISGCHQQLRLVRLERLGGFDRLGPPGESSLGQPLLRQPVSLPIVREEPDRCPAAAAKHEHASG